MIGSWRMSIAAASMMSLLIFFLSFSHNPWKTALIRAGLSFVIFFVVVLAVRWIITTALQSAPVPPVDEEMKSLAPKNDDESSKGSRVDLTTPEHDGSAAVDAPFTPLSPPKLVKKDDSLDPQQLAEAIRQMSEK